jgi:hypothetical protein
VGQGEPESEHPAPRMARQRDRGPCLLPDELGEGHDLAVQRRQQRGRAGGAVTGGVESHDVWSHGRVEVRQRGLPEVVVCVHAVQEPQLRPR